MPKYQTEVVVDLVGPDGNAFAILGLVRSALREAGATSSEIEAYRTEATSGDYANLLAVSGEWVRFSTTSMEEDDDEDDE